MTEGMVAIVGIAMVVGLVGTVVPVMPGLLLMWGAALVYGIVVGFGTVGAVAITIISLLLVAGMVAGYLLPHRAGVRGGAAKSSLRLGILGAAIGFFVIPVVGLPIGGVLGVLVGEYHRLREWSAAWATTKRVLAGFGWAALAEFTAGVAIFATWLGWLGMT